MRKITREAIQHFNKGINFNKGNSRVEIINNTSNLLLHNNKIAIKDLNTGKIKISNGGWSSNTTKGRLNGISGVDIYQKNYKWYLNNFPWDGKWIEIK